MMAEGCGFRAGAAPSADGWQKKRRRDERAAHGLSIVTLTDPQFAGTREIQPGDSTGVEAWATGGLLVDKELSKFNSLSTTEKNGRFGTHNGKIDLPGRLWFVLRTARLYTAPTEGSQAPHTA